MILEVKDSKNYVSVYGYDDVYDWLNDIVQAYETGELLDDFILCEVVLHDLLILLLKLLALQRNGIGFLLQLIDFILDFV